MIDADAKQVAHKSSGALATRPLGRTTMQITRVGLGAWVFGGAEGFTGWGAQDDGDSIAAIRRALDHGINWIDTAPIYGLGHSEEIVGRALRAIPAERRPYVFTKCGVLPGRDVSEKPSLVGGRLSIRRELEGSLRRLGVERIDLYQMHWPSTDGLPLEDYWQTLKDLKQEGKVRAIGLCNHDTSQLERAERLSHVDSVQPRFSAISRGAASSTIPWCKEHDTGVIVYSPLQSGLLSGAFTKERAACLGKDDWRSRHPDFRGRRLARNIALAKALSAVAERLGTSVATVAVAWTLAWPGVTGAIVGARRRQHVDGWVDAATIALIPEDLSEIATAIRELRAGEGPDCPIGPRASKTADRHNSV